MSNTFTGKVSGRMSSRGWAIALGIGAVVLAAILLVVYLDRYRARVGGENAPTPVLVAKQLIPTGTPGSIVATKSMYAPTTLPKKEVEVGAISDPVLPRRPRRRRRHLPRPADHGHGLRRERHDLRRLADHGHAARALDLDRQRARLSSRRCRPATRSTCTPPSAGVVKLFAPNVKVLTIPAIPGPSGGSNLVLRIETAEASKWAYAADNTQLIFVLRPVVGAKPTKPSQANAATVLR